MKTTFIKRTFWVFLVVALPLSLVFGQEPEKNFDFSPGAFRSKQTGKRTELGSIWGFGPTFVQSNSEVDGTFYPEFKPFRSWSNDLGVTLRTRLGAAESKFYINYGLVWRYLNLEMEDGFMTNSTDLMGENPKPRFVEAEQNNSEMNVHTLSIPLLFEYRSTFSFAIGAFAAYRIASSSERDVKLLGDRYETTIRSDFGLNDLLYGATAQIGGKHVRLYINYYLNNLFKNDEPYDFTVMNVGICVQ